MAENGPFGTPFLNQKSPEKVYVCPCPFVWSFPRNEAHKLFWGEHKMVGFPWPCYRGHLGPSAPGTHFPTLSPTLGLKGPNDPCSGQKFSQQNGVFWVRDKKFMLKKFNCFFGPLTWASRLPGTGPEFLDLPENWWGKEQVPARPKILQKILFKNNCFGPFSFANKLQNNLFTKQIPSQPCKIRF